MKTSFGEIVKIELDPENFKGEFEVQISPKILIEN